MDRKRKKIWIILVCVTALTGVVVFFACTEAALFVGEEIRREQVREQVKLIDEIALLRTELFSLEEVLAIQRKRSLYVSEKEDVYDSLAALEEKALTIERMSFFYPQDLSVHLFPRFKNSYTDAIFDHARNIHTLTRRFVRMQEQILFAPLSTQSQRDLAQQRYEEIMTKVESLCDGAVADAYVSCVPH